MIFRTIKRYLLPKGLYTRAALILIFPIVTIQLVVSTVFIQRLYEDVTRQMTQNLLYDLQYLIDGIPEEVAPDIAATEIMRRSAPLAISVKLPAEEISEERRAFYDLSGRVVIDVLGEELAGFQAADLVTDDRSVRFTVATEYGPLEMKFHRYRVSARNPHQLLVLMIFMSILMTVIAYPFLRNQLRPIKRLASASEAFGRGQMVEYQPSGAIEVRAAGRSFLSMRARIERQIEQRTLMLSGVSHDLRTPLTRMRLALSMADDTSEVQDMLRDIDEMETLLSSFLDYARGDGPEEMQTCDPMGLLREAAEKASRAGQRVDLRPLQSSPPLVELRPTAVTRALDNLVSNALRYGTRCELALTVLPEHLIFTVEDDGPGIPADKHEEALRPFTRLEPSRNQNLGAGVGLGLSITHDIVRGHGGELRLSTSGELGGLKAEIILPYFIDGDE